MNRLEVRNKTISCLIVTLFIIGFIPQAVWSGQSYESYNEFTDSFDDGFDLDPIYIFYEPSNSTMDIVAESVDEVIRFRVKDVHLIPISSA